MRCAGPSRDTHSDSINRHRVYDSPYVIPVTTNQVRIGVTSDEVFQRTESSLIECVSHTLRERVVN